MSKTVDLTHCEYTFRPIRRPRLPHGGRLFVFGEQGIPYLSPGDFVLLRNGERTTRYRVTNRRDFGPSADNHDFACDVEFVPRLEEP